MSTGGISNLNSVELVLLLQYVLDEAELNSAIYNFSTFCGQTNFVIKMNPKFILRKWKDLFPNEPIYSGFKRCIMYSDLSQEGKLYLCQNFNMYIQTLYKIILIQNATRGLTTKVFETK